MNIKSMVDFSENDYNFTRGLYAREGSYRWSANKSSFLIKRSGHDYLQIKLYFPDAKSYENTSSQIRVCINGDLLITRDVHFGDINEFKVEVPQKYKMDGIYNIELLSDARINKEMSKDNRDLSFIVCKVGFVY